MSANALQALLALFKNRQQAMNPVWGDIEQRAYRRGYESALEKCIEDVVMQSEAAPPERKIVQISEGGIEGKPGAWDADAWTTGLCNDGSVWRLHGGPDGAGAWYRMPPIPQGEST